MGISKDARFGSPIETVDRKALFDFPALAGFYRTLEKVRYFFPRLQDLLLFHLFPGRFSFCTLPCVIIVGP
jgi:hypothetical protein